VSNLRQRMPRLKLPLADYRVLRHIMRSNEMGGDANFVASRAICTSTT
jgi:hypothetical protein